MSDEGKNPCYCAAHGCNQLGTMTSSTSGASEWWCFLHFGKEATRLQPITVEVNRREWLSQAITDIRTRYWSAEWPSTFKFVQHELAMNQRNDLQYGDQDGNVWAWVRRLEGELAAMIGSTFTNPPKQQRIEAEGLTRLQLPMPEPA